MRQEKERMSELLGKRSPFWPEIFHHCFIVSLSSSVPLLTCPVAAGERAAGAADGAALAATVEGRAEAEEAAPV